MSHAYLNLYRSQEIFLKKMRWRLFKKDGMTKGTTVDFTARELPVNFY